MLSSLLIAIVIVSMPIALVLVTTRLIHNVGKIVIVTPPPPPELKLNVYKDEN